MTRVLLRSAIIGAAAIAAFVLGRAWPRPPSTMISSAAAPPPSDAAATVVRPASRDPRAAVPLRRVAGRDPPTAFNSALDNAEGTARLRSDVVVTVSERRRRHNATVRVCIDGGALIEDALLRFSVEVHAVDGRAEVGPAVIVDVLEGPPLGDDTLACLLSAMDERETIELARAVTYDGTIDVPIRFTARRAP